jgi:hypothetical protein
MALERQESVSVIHPRPETIYRALSILQAAGALGIEPGAFASRMWPERRSRSREMAIAGSALLGPLRKLYLVTRLGRGGHARYLLTDHGTSWLRDFYRVHVAPVIAAAREARRERARFG